mmetsp:Transcript_16232/g.24062  ORF Transcript_16232/g.24062 Transcript_16232/m.24062 type:complete len:213 (-) Transcript_16232:1007-1645(-)
MLEVFVCNCQIVQNFSRNSIGINVDDVHFLPNAVQGSFHAKLGQISPDESVRVTGQLLKVNVRRKFHGFRFDSQDFQSAFFVGLIYRKFSVESAEPSQRRIDYIWSIGGANHDDMRSRLDPIHQSQKLRNNSLFEFPASFVPSRGNTVDFIDENDGRSIGLGFLERLSKIRFTFTAQFAHNFRSVDGEAVRAGFRSDGPGNHRFSAARWTVH